MSCLNRIDQSSLSILSLARETKMNIKIIIRKIKTVLRNPQSVAVKGLYKISPLLNDENYLNLLFPLKTGYRLDLNSPKTFNEKLQWLKINYRKPIMTQMVDKYESKNYVRNIIGDEYIIENYGVWESFDEIKFDELPNQFVLKTTHDQGGVIIVRDKNKLDLKYAKSKLNTHLKIQHYYLTREWPYKNVKPRIIAEKLLLSNLEPTSLIDYKFLCFNGEPKVMYITHGDDKNKYYDYYDMNFEQLNIKRGSLASTDGVLKRPESWSLMLDICRKLSKGFPHIRVDLYCLNGAVYFGELTFYQGGGMRVFHPREWDSILGEWINIDKYK